MFRSLLLSGLILFTSHAAFAQDGTMKACGEKWQAAKEAGTTGGATWPKFLAECRAEMAASPAKPAEPAAKASAKPAEKPADKPASKPSADPSPASTPAASAKAPVFPSAVSPKFADLRPSQARQKTCSEQYQSNKASDANGGLRWLEKGGGYWSLCNKKLKGA